MVGLGCAEEVARPFFSKKKSLSFLCLIRDNKRRYFVYTVRSVSHRVNFLRVLFGVCVWMCFVCVVFFCAFASSPSMRCDCPAGAHS